MLVGKSSLDAFPKSTLFWIGCVKGPIFEEMYHRGFQQDLILKILPKWLIKKITKEESPLDSVISKVFRTVITATAFSLVHLQNQETPSYLKSQVVSTFILGLGLGILKESKVGLSGSIGAHMAYNTFAFAPLLLKK